MSEGIGETEDLRKSMPGDTMPLRRNWRFQLLLGGSSLSMLGSRLTSIAYPMLVLFLTGSPAMAGFALSAATLPSIFVYLPAGSLVDCWKPRRTLLASESLRGLAIMSVVIMVATGLVARHHGLVWCIIGAAVLEEILEVFATLSERRLIQLLVPPELSSAAQVRVEARAHVVVLLGRALGGMLFTAAPALPFLADAVSFACSIGSALGIGKNYSVQNRQAAHGSTLGPGVRAALGWLRKHPAACRASLLLSGLTLVCQALIIVFLGEASSWHLPSVDIGIALAASGLGGVAGAVAGQRLRVLAKVFQLKFQPIAWVSMLVILALSGASLPCMAAVMLVLGFTGAMGNVELDTYLMQRVDNGMLARVTSLEMLLSMSACALGPVIGGFLAESVGVVDSIWLLTGLMALGAVFAWLMPSLFEPPEPEKNNERTGGESPALATSR